MTTDQLKTSLQSEAAHEAPQFSPLLHERIMQRLRADETTQRAITAPSARRPLWPYAAAASLLIAASYLVYHIYQPAPAPQPIIAHQIPTPTELTAPVGKLITPAVQQVDDAKYAYLDHDAKNFVTFLASQLPSPPTK